MKIVKFILICLSTVIFYSCTASSQSTDENKEESGSEEVYVFDDVIEDTASTEQAEAAQPEPEASVPEIDTTQTETKKFEFYIVQVGAFTTEERAKVFIEENQPKIEDELTFHFSEDVNLYVVQLPPFRTREAAESKRDYLWQMDAFKDAFIVPQ